MNNIIERVWKRDSMVNIEDLRGSAFQNEKAGHTFIISGIDGDGETVSLSGTVAGSFLRPDGTTVAIVGSASEGKVSVTLPENCYDVPGKFGLTIFLTENSQKTAIYAAIGAVARTSSSTAAPGTTQDVVDLVNAIETAISQIPASDTNLKGAMAPTYSTSAIYAVGSYAWYDGKLYKCTTAITSGETWTSAHWTEAKLANDVTDLKSALNDSTGNTIIDNWLDGYAYSTPSSVSNVSINSPTATANYSCLTIPCTEGDVFYITGAGASGAKLWVLAKSNGDIISRADSNTTGDNLKIVAPTDAAYLLVNAATANIHRVIKNEFLSARVTNIENSYQPKNEIFGNIQTVPLANVYYGTVGSGTTLQVRTSTSSYNGIIIQIPYGVTDIDLSDMTPYSVTLFTHEPVIGSTDGTSATVTNKTVSFAKGNTYTWALVTLRLSDGGNNKESFAVHFSGKIDERIANQEQKIESVVNGKNIPIVCFVYDDNPSGDSTLHTMLNARGLKGTFSTIGNTNPTDSTWKATAENLQKWVAEGHGVLGHGLTSGVSVTILTDDSLAGISNISDADARKAIEANNKALDFYNLPHNGIAYWNIWSDTPHSRNIVEKYYNYGFTFGGSGAGINTLATDKFRLTRYTTDAANHIDTAIEMLRSAIGQKCIIVFGGHMSRTGTGSGSYSTMEQFTSLLDAVKDYVDAGVMISLNTDDAVKLFYGDYNGVKNEYPYLPAVGEIVYNNGLKVCTSAGSALIVRVTLSGTPQDGRITIPVLDIDVETNSTDSLNDIILRIVEDSLHPNFTIIRSSSSQCYCYSNIARATETPEATVNTSGLSIAFAVRKNGENPVWS